MRRTLTTAALVLALACPAFAGIMHTPGAAPPPAEPMQEEPMRAGESETEATESLAETVLSVLESVLALL